VDNILKIALVITVLTQIVILVPVLDARSVKAPIIFKELHALLLLIVGMVTSKMNQILHHIYVKLAKILTAKPAQMEQTHLNVRFAMRQIVISKIQMYQKQHADFVQQLSMEILLPMLAMIV